MWSSRKFRISNFDFRMAAKKNALGLKGAVKTAARKPAGSSRKAVKVAGKKAATFHSFDDVRAALKKQGGRTDG
jgi:hypothetical protein